MTCLNSGGEAEKKRLNSSCLCLLFYSGPQQIGLVPTHTGRAICCAEGTDSRANLGSKHRHRHGRKLCLIWALCGPGELTHKIKHHSWEGIISNSPRFPPNPSTEDQRCLSYRVLPMISSQQMARMKPVLGLLRPSPYFSDIRLRNLGIWWRTGSWDRPSRLILRAQFRWSPRPQLTMCYPGRS